MTEKWTAVVADDDAAIRKLLAMILKIHGFKVHEAADGVQAKELVEKHKPDLLATDYNMPGMRGNQLVEALRKAGNHDVSVLGISGAAGGEKDPESMQSYVTEHNERYANRAPAMHFLAKPFSVPKLQAKLQEMGFRS